MRAKLNHSIIAISLLIAFFISHLYIVNYLRIEALCSSLNSGVSFGFGAGFPTWILLGIGSVSLLLLLLLLLILLHRGRSKTVCSHCIGLFILLVSGGVLLSERFIWGDICDYLKISLPRIVGTHNLVYFNIPDLLIVGSIAYLCLVLIKSND